MAIPASPPLSSTPTDEGDSPHSRVIGGPTKDVTRRSNPSIKLITRHSATALT